MFMYMHVQYTQWYIAERERERGGGGGGKKWMEKTIEGGGEGSEGVKSE